MASARDLPRVDALSACAALEGFPEAVRIKAARQAIEELRAAVLAGRDADISGAEELAAGRARKLLNPTMRPALNMTGVVLHTGLGRARLARPVVEQVAQIVAEHCLVELDVETGKRGSRQNHVKGMLQELTGAEDALVVNNCAAAILLSLTALCAGKEVILSRGEMIEIGGAFRMPDVVRHSGCRLIEVGCTNKTHLRDYEDAITEDTGAILRCHQSNYRMIGFVERQSLRELCELGRRRGVAVVEDIGAGCLLDTSRFGLPKEETLQEAIQAGPDVVTSSGDKLLGGPQCGIILGKAEALAHVKKHPLARAVRVDKLTMATLEATLRMYATGREMELPVWQYISKDPAVVKRDAERIAKAYRGKCAVAETITEVGGGSVPGFGVPSWRVGLEASDAEGLLAALRKLDPPIVGRIEDGQVWLDPRTLDEQEVDRAVKTISNLTPPGC